MIVASGVMKNSSRPSLRQTGCAPPLRDTGCFAPSAETAARNLELAGFVRTEGQPAPIGRKHPAVFNEWVCATGNGVRSPGQRQDPNVGAADCLPV